MKKQLIIFLVLFITGLVIFSCSKGEQSIETKTEQSTEARNGKQGYIEHTLEELAFIHSVKTKVNNLNHFDFGEDFLNIKGTPDWSLAIIPHKNGGDYKSIIVPITKGDEINAFFYVFDGEELMYNYVDKSLIRPPYFVYVGPVNHVNEQVLDFYYHVLSNIPLEDGSGYDDGIFEDPEYGGCWVTTTEPVDCSCTPHHSMGEECSCELIGGTNPYIEFTSTPVPCEEEGGGGPGGSVTVSTGSGGNNWNGNNGTAPKIVIARKAANSVCPIIPQIACDKLNFIIDNASDSDYCLYIATQVADLLEDPTTTNKAAATCFIMSIDVQQNPSSPNTCSSPFNSKLAEFAEMYNEMNSDLISWVGFYTGLDNVPCDLTVAGYSSEEKNQILQAFKDYLGTPPPTGSGDILPINNPELDNVNALNAVLAISYKPELISMISFFLANPQHIPFISEFVSKVDVFVAENNLDEDITNFYKAIDFNCNYDSDFTSCSKSSLIANLKLSLLDSEIDYFKSNFEIYQKVESFIDSKKSESESKQNLSKAIASGYVKLLKDENLTDLSIDLGEVGNFGDEYWAIAKDLLLESIKELLIDLIPGGTLATIGPEVINNVQSGNWMDAMYGVADIVLNEADALFPAAKVASFSIGAFVTGKQLKKVFKAFKKAKALGEDFLKKLYNIFRKKLNWSVSTLREKFRSIEGIGAKIDDIVGSEFLEMLKDEFGETYAGFNDNPAPLGSGNPVWKLIDLPANKSVFCLYYPESSQGYHTIALYIASSTASSYQDIKSSVKLKLRFDN